VYAREAAKVAPKSFAARNTLGRMLVDSGELEEGIKELEAARALAPDSPQTRIALASAYAKAGRKEEAARERQEFKRLWKQSDDRSRPQ
jgi:Flp pilus assembly protein TadD